jgi:hypothetical protein
MLVLRFSAVLCAGLVALGVSLSASAARDGIEDAIVGADVSATKSSGTKARERATDSPGCMIAGRPCYRFNGRCYVIDSATGGYLRLPSCDEK